jgi:hypothetical protein
VTAFMTKLVSPSCETSQVFEDRRGHASQVPTAKHTPITKQMADVVAINASV